MGAAMSCIFCEIVQGRREARVVYDDALCLAFLDHRPLFPGHSLLIPKAHHETLSDLPSELVPAFFLAAQRLTRAVERATAAEGSFVAMNNRVSQSVPHLHVHVVPRRRKDGLRGFFWPRQKYETTEAEAQVQAAIAAELRGLSGA
jgi:histidine triad (HIT) family protein